MKSACVFDWDGTLRRGTTALDWMEFLIPALPTARSAWSGMRVLLENYRLGNVAYEDLVRSAAEIYGNCVAGIDVSEVERLASAFVEKDRAKLFDFAEELLCLAKLKQYSNFVVSGAPLEAIEAYKKILPIDQIVAVVIERRNGKFTGSVVVNHGLTERKRAVMTQLISGGFRIAVAAGNSASDLPLIERADHGFLISDEHEIDHATSAAVIDIAHARTKLLEAL